MLKQNIRAAIEVALSTPALLEAAQKEHAAIAADVLSRNHERKPGTLRASDAGGCVLEKWADVHGKLDLPDAPKSTLRMNNGSLMGAWLACLLKVGLQALRPELRVTCEAEVEHDGVPGHVDAIIARGDLVLAVVEFKWSAWTGKQDDCKSYQWLQSGKYGLAAVAGKHFVAIYYAAAQESIYDKETKSRIPTDWLVVHEFDTHETAVAVLDEFDRLTAALEDFPPVGDAVEDWRCRSCRYSACHRNARHNAQKSVDDFADFAASVAPEGQR